MTSLATMKEEEDWEFEEEEAENYEWEYETESEDDVVDKAIANGVGGSKSGGGGNSSKPAEATTATRQPAEKVTKAETVEDEEEEEEEITEIPDPFTPKAEPKANASEGRTEATRTNGTNGKAEEEVKEESENREEKKKKRRESHDNGENGERKHHRKHKKSRHIERLEAFTKTESSNGSSKDKVKKIHVRSKDPSRIARQLEKNITGSKTASKGSRGGRPAPPEQKYNTICKICGKEPYLVERLVAEKSWWHKNCFRCKQCSKSLNLDTYMSHEGVIYCKPHHKELFQPKVIKSDIIDLEGKKKGSFTQDAIARHKEQERRMETIVRESNPIDLGDQVVKSSTTTEETKYQGLENLDVGSKFKMFEKADDDDEDEDDNDDHRLASSDRYGIMDRLKRLQEGADLDELLAEIDEELPSDHEDEDPDEMGMTAVQKKTYRAEKLFGESGQERRDKLADDRKRELKTLREKLMTGTRDNVLDQFGDILNASANKIKKTKIDVKSENAKKFRDMFDKGEVPEAVGLSSSDRTILEKEQELENMRKVKRQQKDFFKRMESGQMDEDGPKEPKLLVGKIKDGGNDEDLPHGDLPELTSLSNRFSFFENYMEKEEERQKKTTREGVTLPTAEDDEDDDEVAGAGAAGERVERRTRHHERDMARKECKARSVLNKFKEMEAKVLNGEDDVGDRRPLKRFTPPRKLGSDESGSDYTDSEYSDSEDYSDSESYTSSSYSGTDSEEDEDETLRAIRAAARAKALRAKFEEWEQTKDAQDQSRQLIADENGASLETASNLKARFEALNVHEEQAAAEAAAAGAAGGASGGGQPRQKFRPKRFK